MIVATTHFFPALKEDPQVGKSANELEPEQTMLYEMESVSHGGHPVFPVKPHLLLSSDDKTQYIFEGGGGELGVKDTFRLTTSESINVSGMKSVYKKEQVNQMNGM